MHLDECGVRGRTSLYLNPNLTRSAEYGWSSAGGGCSGYFAIPISQSRYSFESQVCSPNRAAPDIAALADPNTGFAVHIGGPYYGGYYYLVGGTSRATPINAGLIADIDAARVTFGKAPLTCDNSTARCMALPNHNAVGYHAGTRFDLITGLGVPDGKAIGSRFFGIP